MEIKYALSTGQDKLNQYSPTAALDAEILLSFVINKTREFLYSHPEKKLNKLQQKKYSLLINKRRKLEPIAYLTSHKEFFGLDFYVNKNVLVPRPDTEILVEEVLKLNDKTNIILDVGTGSGCIAIALKKYLPKIDVIATDISKTALDVARKNARKILNCELREQKKNYKNISFYCSDLLKNIPKKYKNKINVITFNPPYLTKNEARKKMLKYEPQIALTPDNFKKLILEFFKQCKYYLSSNSYVFLEVGYRQINIIKKIATKQFSNPKITVIKDLGGYERVMQISIDHKK